jgi:hypothetical protein
LPPPIPTIAPIARATNPYNNAFPRCSYMNVLLILYPYDFDGGMGFVDSVYVQQ